MRFQGFVLSRRLAGIAMVFGMLVLPGQALATRYVTPIGTPADDCQSVATACDLNTAVEGVVGNLPAAGEEVIVEPGVIPLSALTDNGAPNLNIHGAFGQPRPVINQTDPGGLLRISSGSVSDLNFESGGTNVINLNGGLMERVFMRGAGSGNVVCQCYGGLLRDSVVISTGSTAGLGVVSNGGTATMSYRNVTAIATNPGTPAIMIDQGGAPNPLTFDAYNVIARNTAGGGPDVQAFGIGASITFHHSNYGIGTQTGGGIVQDAPGDPHQAATPLFVNPGAGDFSEAAGSPTIDAGLTDALNGPLDLAGNARALGGSTDIGAYEVVPPSSPPPPPPNPPASKRKKCKKHKKHKKSSASAAKKSKKCKKHRK